MNQQTHYILLALGSNIAAEQNIDHAKARLLAVFPQLQFSRSLITPAIGIVSPPFTNCLAEGYAVCSWKRCSLRSKTLRRRWEVCLKSGRKAL